MKYSPEARPTHSGRTERYQNFNKLGDPPPPPSPSKSKARIKFLVQLTRSHKAHTTTHYNFLVQRSWVKRRGGDIAWRVKLFICWYIKQDVWLNTISVNIYVLWRWKANYLVSDIVTFLPPCAEVKRNSHIFAMASCKTTAYRTLLVLVFADKQWYIDLTITIKMNG